MSLDPTEAHHLHQVLRAKPGQTVDVFDGLGRCAEARVGASPEQLELVPDSLVQHARSAHCTLYMAILKPARMDLAIEKATELGVDHIVPLFTEHCVAHVDAANVDKKRARWFRIATSAAKQCGTPWLPEVHSPLTLTDLCEMIQAGQWVALGALTGASVPLKAALREAACARATSEARQVGLAIGPEGDFSPSEMQQLLEAGAVPVSFGSRVLRAETAALFGLSVIMSELDDAHL